MGAAKTAFWALTASVLTFMAGAALQSRDDERICRHAIQRNFGVARDAAQSLIDEERKEDW
jgi:hypothetical protein